MLTVEAACVGMCSFPRPSFLFRRLPPSLTQVYGKYYSALTKRGRTELADANAEAEEVLGSMATIKAHAAQVGKCVSLC